VVISSHVSMLGSRDAGCSKGKSSVTKLSTPTTRARKATTAPAVTRPRGGAERAPAAADPESWTKDGVLVHYHSAIYENPTYRPLSAGCVIILRIPVAPFGECYLRFTLAA
jgi:hypothetical protein